MDTFVAVCFAIPAAGFLNTVVRDWRELRLPPELEVTMATKVNPVWRMKDGKEIVCKTMEDRHLINAIKMVARNGMKPSYLGDFKSTGMWKKLVSEAKRRGWKVTHLSTPNEIHGRKEWVDVWTPTPRSMLSINMHISEWDSRLDE